MYSKIGGKLDTFYYIYTKWLNKTLKISVFNEIILNDFLIVKKKLVFKNIIKRITKKTFKSVKTTKNKYWVKTDFLTDKSVLDKIDIFKVKYQ